MIVQPHTSAQSGISRPASGGKSADHPDYASPDRPKVVDVDLQVDLDSWNVEKELVTCRQGGPNRFRNIPNTDSSRPYYITK